MITENRQLKSFLYEVVSMAKSGPEEFSEIRIIQREEKQPMSSEDASKVLGLISRWAIRKARKQAEAGLRSDGDDLTDELSKDYADRKIQI